MSNRRRIRNPLPQHPFTAMISALDGAQIPGGCASCDAYQVVRAHAHGPNIHVISVYHDDDCPELAVRQARQ